MQIESKTIIGLERDQEKRVAARSKEKGPRDLFFLPIRALAWLPIFAEARKEARSITITQQSVEIAQLPPAFDGVTVAFLTDFHCSPTTPASFLERVVAETNRLQPELVLLGGDYVSEGTDYIRPVGKVLK